MDQRQSPALYVIRPAVAAPILVSGAAAYLAVIDSRWWLLSIPFAILASFGAQPNLNMADGCLAFLAMIIGLAIAFFHERSGLAISLGSLAGFVLSGIEKRLTAKPALPEHRGNPKGSDQP